MSNILPNSPALPSTLDLAPYEPGLRRYLRRRAPPGQVDDLIQEVFVRLLALRDPAAVVDLERYLFVVASSVLSLQRRRQGPLEAVDDRELASRLGHDFTPERVLLGKDDLRVVLGVLDGLPSRTRQIFMLHRFEEMTYQRIAGALAISVSAVEKHMMTALKALLLRHGPPR